MSSFAIPIPSSSELHRWIAWNGRALYVYSTKVLTLMWTLGLSLTIHYRSWLCFLELYHPGFVFIIICSYYQNSHLLSEQGQKLWRKKTSLLCRNKIRKSESMGLLNRRTSWNNGFIKVLHILCGICHYREWVMS